MQLKTIGLFIVIGVLMISTGFGQENYLPANVIGVNGDTIHGFIDYRNWGKNPDRISFKKLITDQAVTQTPLDIRGFTVAGEGYVSALILNDLSPLITNDLEYGKEPRVVPDTIFLQSLVMGSKSLFLYRNKIGRDLFYIKSDTTFILLEYKRYIANSQTTDALENKKYLNQLAFYLKDCPVIQQNLASLQYSRKSLASLFQTYYKCIGTPIKFQQKTEKVKVELGAVVGATINNLYFKGIETLYLTQIDFKTNVNYAVGLYANLVLTRNQGKWSLYNELAFAPYKVENFYEMYVNENDYKYNTITLGYSYLKLNSMLRFTYPVAKTFVFINAGMSNGYALKEINNINIEQKFYSSETIKDDRAVSSTRLYEQGIICGVGVKYDKFSFEFRYENGNGMSNFMNLNSKTTRYLFLAGYKFR